MFVCSGAPPTASTPHVVFPIVDDTLLSNATGMEHQQDVVPAAEASVFELHRADGTVTSDVISTPADEDGVPVRGALDAAETVCVCAQYRLSLQSMVAVRSTCRVCSTCTRYHVSVHIFAPVYR